MSQDIHVENTIRSLRPRFQIRQSQCRGNLRLRAQYEVLMAYRELEISGGDTVFCINEMQLRRAKEIMEHDPDSSEKIRLAFEKLTKTLTPNEQAALAFLIIEKLLP